MKKLPSLPRAIHLPAGGVPVTTNVGLYERESTFGKFNWIKRTIELEASMGLTPAWLTLRHERVHAILMDSGIELPHDLEERVCDAIALADVADMQRGKK